MDLRRILLVLGVVVPTLLFGAASGCTALLGDFEIGTTPAEAGVGLPTGDVCQTGAECATGQCVDGVCCEAACDGTCERCNVQGFAGKCMPVPDGEDPDNECPTTPLPPPDAGAPVDAGGADGAADGGDAGTDGGAGGIVDAGVLDAGSEAGAVTPVFAVPDGGVVADDNQCAGKCNGRRACHYPGAERTCGSVFCGTKTQQGRAACDGKGHCLVGIEECSAFACPDGSPGCAKTCTGEKDCLPTHFCDAQTSTCKPKLEDGSGCVSLAQCKSGFCVSNVCCNDSCSGYPGASCTVPGSVGKCRCSACDTGPCRLYYMDEDRDGFGDEHGTVANGRATPGCVGGPAPPGFVDNNADCFDGAGFAAYNARPNQEGYFDQPFTPRNGVPSYDYNCDNSIQKQTPEFVGATCGFCFTSNFPRDCAKRSTCGTAGEQAGLACTPSLCKLPCTPCQTITTVGFTTTIGCGQTGTATDCGSCTASGAAVSGTTTRLVVQRCH